MTLGVTIADVKCIDRSSSTDDMRQPYTLYPTRRSRPWQAYSKKAKRTKGPSSFSGHEGATMHL